MARIEKLGIFWFPSLFSPSNKIFPPGFRLQSRPDLCTFSWIYYLNTVFKQKLLLFSVSTNQFWYLFIPDPIDQCPVWSVLPTQPQTHLIPGGWIKEGQVPGGPRNTWWTHGRSGLVMLLFQESLSPWTAFSPLQTRMLLLMLPQLCYDSIQNDKEKIWREINHNIDRDYV